MKENKKQRSEFAQNRIDYIVYGNPEEAAKLLKKYSVTPSYDTHLMVDEVKRLIRGKGKKVIHELINIHPDKKAIIRQVGKKQDNYCGGCAAYSYNPESSYCNYCGQTSYTGDEEDNSIMQRIVDMNINELEKYYKDLLMDAGENPDDLSLAEELHLVWNELKARKEAEKEQGKALSEYLPKKNLMFFGSILIAGILIGSSFRRKLA